MTEALEIKGQVKSRPGAPALPAPAMATSGKGVSSLRRAWQGPTILPQGSEAPLGCVAQPTVPVRITQSLGSVAILTLYRRFRERGSVQLGEKVEGGGQHIWGCGHQTDGILMKILKPF